MIKFKPLSCRNENWIYQPDFYLHGKLSTNYETDSVVMQDDVFHTRISRYYREGIGLAPTFLDIPEGKHLCEVDGILCAIFVWKKIVFCKGGWVGDQGYSGPFDVWLRQIGLIVDITDKEGVLDAQNKFNNRESFI